MNKIKGKTKGKDVIEYIENDETTKFYDGVCESYE